MNIRENIIRLINDMIAFSVVVGRLYPQEYNFLKLIASELKISKAIFNDLFYQEFPKMVIVSEFERVQQFYSLALLMQSD